jgi:hypothetical protein
MRRPGSEDASMGIEQIYERTIKPLPVEERLRLARLILDEISAGGVVDFSEEWSEDDLRELTAAAWSRADASASRPRSATD